MAKAVDKGPVDLSDFDGLTEAQEAGIDVDIKGPDGKPLGFSIKIAGPDSERQKTALRELQDEMIENEDAGVANAEQREKQTLEIMARSTIAWTEFKLGGEVYTFSVDNARALYARYPWLYEQIIAKGARRKAFLQRS